jgi:hypothetical protein
MKKIPTFFPKNPENLKLVLPDEPVIDLREDKYKPYFKLDGRACAIINGKLYTRYDAKLLKRKRGKIIKRYTKEEIQQKLPKEAIACQEPDEKSGHWPHWIPCNPKNKDHEYIFEAYENSLKEAKKRGNKYEVLEDGTYECIGPKVNANPHNLTKHYLINHRGVPMNVKLHYPLFNKEWLKDVYEKKDWKKLYENFKLLMEFIPFEGVVFWDIEKNEPVCKIRKSDYDLKTENYSNLGLL